MSNGINRPSARKQAGDALARLDEIEKVLTQLPLAMNQALNRISQQVSQIAEQLNAVVGILGVDAVAKAIQEERNAKDIADAERTKAEIEKGLAEGKLLLQDVVTEESIVTGVEYDKDGGVIVPGFIAAKFTDIEEEYKANLLGKGAGFEFATKTGGKFIVERAFVIAPPPEATAKVEQAADGSLTVTQEEYPGQGTIEDLTVTKKEQ